MESTDAPAACEPHRLERCGELRSQRSERSVIRRNHECIIRVSDIRAPPTDIADEPIERHEDDVREELTREVPERDAAVGTRRIAGKPGTGIVAPDDLVEDAKHPLIGDPLLELRAEEFVRNGIKKFPDIEVQHVDRRSSTDALRDSPDASNRRVCPAVRPTGHHRGREPPIEERKRDVPYHLMHNLIVYHRHMDRATLRIVYDERSVRTVTVCAAHQRIAEYQEIALEVPLERTHIRTVSLPTPEQNPRAPEVLRFNHRGERIVQLLHTPLLPPPPMDHTLMFQKAYDCIRLAANLVPSFPKVDRYGLGIRLEQTILDVLEAVITAEVTAPTLKDRALVDAAVHADIGIVLCRLARERKLVGDTNYLTLAGMLQEIAKMANGWRKSLQQK